MSFEATSDDTDQSGPDVSLRVLVCPDQRSWAFDNIANNIAKHAGSNRMHKLYIEDLVDKEHALFERIFLDRIDVCHLFWREDLFYMLHPQTIDRVARKLGFDYATMVKAINSCAFTTSVYDHLFSSPEEMRDRRLGFGMIDGYTVCSRKLHDIYASEPGIPAPDAVMSDGVDTQRFSPLPVPRSSSGRPALGWAGNSAWGALSQGYDVKGYQRLFVPLVAELGSRGLAVETKVADPRVKRIPFEEMPDFYRGLDVFVCTSAMEGTPNPVLEAMACGIPIVSSDVGIVSEAFGPLQSRFIVRRATPEAFADAAAELLADKALRTAISEENRARALEWSWDNKGHAWWPFWKRMLRRATDHRHAIRRESYLLAQAAIL